jgi:SAM-dependent methyltransferase
VPVLRLHCHVCGTDFSIPWELNATGGSACPGCSEPVRVEDGMILFGPAHSAVRSKGERVWELARFERAYSQQSEYRDHLEHARLSAIPAFVEEYRYARLKGWIIRQLASVEGELLMDVGTGAGYFLYQIRDAYPSRRLRLIGTDISPSHLRLLARRVAQDAQRSIVPIVCDGESLPFPPDTFDIVTCSEVIEHVFDKPRAMAEMARVLKPGGALFLTTPCRSTVLFWNLVFALPRRLYRAVKRKGPIPPGGGAYDEPVSPACLRRMAQEAGLVVEHMRCVVCVPHESYLQFIPEPLLRIWLVFASVAEHFGLGFLIGLHIRMRARKPRGPAR